MRMYDIIAKKRDGLTLSSDEIEFFVKGATDGSIPDYQISALLMAIFLKGMNEEETVNLTWSCAHSGDMVDLSPIAGVKVDKHSTGGVGDKTTLVVAPIVASCGAPVAKMSGRGLGYTGGTIDKLESLGIKTGISQEEFFKIIKQVGLSVIGQSGNLAPADKKLYALRDVTATVNNISLIAASIMSKKLASGADKILLDVKTGTGAFMKTLEDSAKLAEAMVSIGNKAGKETVALITDMDRPLGYAIGNSLEVKEAINTLRGDGPKDLYEICIELSATMLELAGKGALRHCRQLAENAVVSGKAILKFKDMVAAQGGNARLVDDASLFEDTEYIVDILSDRSGFISHMQTEACGIASVILGAGRETKDSGIDFGAGIMLNAKTGDYVEKGDILAKFHTSSPCKIKEAEETFKKSLQFSSAAPALPPLIYARVSRNGIQYEK